MIDTPYNSASCASPLSPQFLLTNYAGYYAGEGFDENFLTWAPVVDNYNPGTMAWSGCNTNTPHENVGCPASLLDYGPVSGNLSPDDNITVLSAGGAFIALACGNFSDVRPSASPTPTISGTVYDDDNGNGAHDPGELGIPNVVVTLYRNGTQVATATTDPNGGYSFSLSVDPPSDLGPGTYTLSQDVPSGYHQTAAPGSIIVTPNPDPSALDHPGNDFGDEVQPTIATTPSPSVPDGFNISDSATLSGGASPSGSVNFTLYGPGDPTCMTPIASTSGTLSGGTAGSGNIVAGPPGTYNWIASYPGDGANYGVKSSCGSETVVVVPSADVSLTKSAAAVAPPGCTPAQGAQPCVLHGHDVTYTLTESNAGPDTAAAPTITDTLPAGQTFVSATGATCTAAGTPVVVVCPTPDLANGGSDAVYIVASTVGIPPLSAATVQTDHAVASSPTFDINTANNSAQASITVVPVADVSLVKIAAPVMPPGCTPAQGAQPCVLHGQDVTYTLTESNVGPDPAATPTISDTLPAGQTLVSSDDGCTASGTPVVVACPTPTLPNAATDTIHVVASTVGIPPLSAAIVQTNNATVTSPTFDPGPANNSAQASITVVPVADVSLVKLAAPVTPPGCTPAQGTQPCVLHGQNVTYTLTESDAGPDPAITPAITDTLPAGQTLVSSDDGCTTSGVPVVVACPTPTLPNGTSDTIHLVVSTAGIPAPLNVPLLQTDSASVSSATFDPNTANNEASAAITVVPAADLALTKTSAPNPDIAGQQLTYTLTATNNGPDTAVNTVITDTLPPGETLETEGVVEIVGNTIGGAIDVANNHAANPTPGLGGLLCTSAILSGVTTVTCPAGNVLAGATVFAKIIVVPSVGMPVNTGVVGSDTADPNLLNNTATNTTTVTSNCTVTRTGQINAAIIVPTGEFLCLNNATVTASIIVHAGAALTETNSTSGPVDANSPVFVTVCGSTVNGAIAVTDASQLVRIGDSPVLCAPNKISGAVDATGNGGGDGGPAVVGNHVGGSIDCTGDTPVATDRGQPNTTTGGQKLHECSTF